MPPPKSAKVEMGVGMKRTDPQNAALHLMFEQVAETLNDAGFDQQAVWEKRSVPVPNTKESIKELWRSIQKQMYPREDGKEPSTTDLTTGQVGKIYDVFNEAMAEHFGIHVDFPHQEEL